MVRSRVRRTACRMSISHRGSRSSSGAAFRTTNCSRLAERRRLSDPTVLEKQVKRMLADPRSQALVSNFAGQWLYLRNVSSVLPDRRLFPDFNENLRRAFTQGERAVLRQHRA